MADTPGNDAYGALIALEGEVVPAESREVEVRTQPSQEAVLHTLALSVGQIAPEHQSQALQVIDDGLQAMVALRRTGQDAEVERARAEVERARADIEKARALHKHQTVRSLEQKRLFLKEFTVTVVTFTTIACLVVITLKLTSIVEPQFWMYVVGPSFGAMTVITIGIIRRPARGDAGREASSGSTPVRR